MQKFPTELLKEWFLQNRRFLPWREDPTPYRVWISDVMLQQTQVAVVIPYFERWMKTFPTIEALAKAPLESVLKCWEGLGYYSRARNLHQAAIHLIEHCKGELPHTKLELARIKGIGSYTQGAIRSFAFKQKAAAVDGNVLRVLSRFLAFEEEIDLPKAKRKLHAYAESMLPDQESWLVSEGLIELGAQICLKKPKCGACPLSKQCLANRHHLQEILPKKLKRKETILLKRQVAVIQCDGHYLLCKGKEGRVMADLYEFPYLEWQSDQEEEVKAAFENSLQLSLTYLEPLNSQKHSFTHFRAQLFPHLMESKYVTTEHLWMSEIDLKKLPFSSGHRRILESLT